MSLIAWIVLGALAGWIASMIAGTNARQGWLMNIVVGVIGAFLGGWLFSLVTQHDFVAGFNFTTLVVAIGGAAILLFVVRLVTGRAA